MTQLVSAQVNSRYPKSYMQHHAARRLEWAESFEFHPKEKKRKPTEAEGSLPTSIMEKETHWLRRVVSPLHHKGVK
eukprot:989126-Pelagomonas_calceolata.AAC.1